MAYLFNSVTDEEADANKQNIFGGQQPEQGATQGGAFEKEGAPAAPSGGGGGGTSTPSSGGKASTSGGGYNPAATSSAYKTAAANINLPSKALSRAEGQLSEGSKKLQEQADAYTSGYEKEAQGYGLDKSTLAGAAGGKDADYQKTAQRLQQADTSQAYKGFEGLGAEQPNIQNIRDPASLYRAESGPRYTAGQSRFDAAMLRRNPEFIRQQQELLSREKALGEQSKKTAEEKTAAARGYLGKEFEKSTGDIRGNLGKIGEEIISGAKAKQAAEAARRGGIDPNAIGGAEQEKIKAQIREDLSRADPRSEQARSLKYLSDQYDLGDFANVNKDVDWRQFIGSPEAEQYNRVGGLLGQGGEMLNPAEGPGAESSFNQGGAYQQILNQMQQKRQAEDLAGKGKLGELQKAAEGRIGQTKNDVMAQYRALQPQLATMQRSGKLPSDYTFTPPEVSWQSVLTPEEISQYNATATDIGMDPYSNTESTPYSGIKSLQDQIAKWQATQNTLPTGPSEIPDRETFRPTSGEAKNPVKLAEKEKEKPAASQKLKTTFKGER